MDKFLNIKPKTNLNSNINTNSTKVNSNKIIEDEPDINNLEIKEDTNDFNPWVEKYRPQNLDDVVHQSNVIESLKKSIKYNKLQHLLFYGPPGTGKTSTILAVS